MTAFDLRRVAPFDDEFRVVSCTGADLRAAVHDLSLADVCADAPEACFGHVSGMHVVWDDDRSTLCELSVGGDPVAPDQEYTLATVAYFLRTNRRLTAVGPGDVVDSYAGEHPLVATLATSVSTRRPTDGSNGRR
ncbi:5'-nucleotidase, C-terminal domain [Halogranum amylolyticum]|uniref:5'-nucleotidase, C-terminal domain n=1 Tax=Halogranum amylolyticum TaxID=660520 RepID=A0A1H8SNX9_9EURY|nr:5'-nucleotidase, C-terminal domain [Halogranum amylolyticum]